MTLRQLGSVSLRGEKERVEDRVFRTQSHSNLRQGLERPLLSFVSLLLSGSEIVIYLKSVQNKIPHKPSSHHIPVMCSVRGSLHGT